MPHLHQLLPALAALILLLSSCVSKGPDERLATIERSIEENPRKAHKQLKDIKSSSLDEPSGHLRDLLIIKAADKGYDRHTSDRLIHTVLDYYGSHKSDPHYPEALYYAGRVYSDLGDLPTALEYFQKALDATPDIPDNRRFRSNILSQTGRLLERLCMHDQAITYLKQSIGLSKALNDSAGVFYDLMHLMPIYKNCDSLQQAKECQVEAEAYAKAMPPEDQAWLEVERAVTFLHEHKVDSALNVIRPVMNSVDTLCRNYALGIATHTYKVAGIPDTAYLYARALAFSSKAENNLSGFSTLLSPELFPMIPSDSIGFIVSAYRQQMEQYLNTHQSEAALIQNARYNYTVHQRERARAEKERSRITHFCIGLVLIMIAIICYAKIVNRIAIMKLRAATGVIRAMQYKAMVNRLNSEKEIVQVDPCPHLITAAGKRYPLLLSFTSRKEILRKEYFQRLGSLTDMNLRQPESDSRLLESPVKDALDALLSSGKGIKEKMWDDIEITVLELSPEFKSTLMTLSLEKMTDREYQVALLIRYGFKPKEISTLISRGKSTATDRRRSLARKIFGSSADTTVLDRVILSI